MGYYFKTMYSALLISLLVLVDRHEMYGVELREVYSEIIHLLDVSYIATSCKSHPCLGHYHCQGRTFLESRHLILQGVTGCQACLLTSKTAPTCPE